jgi:hypothetical protein
LTCNLVLSENALDLIDDAPDVATLGDLVEVDIAGFACLGLDGSRLFRDPGDDTGDETEAALAFDLAQGLPLS